MVLVVAPFFNFTKDENKILKPLKEAHKRQGTYWERAYQAVKHDRYSSLQKGNVKAFIHALAALYLLNLYYRNDSWVTKYQDISKQDYSMGSAIFSVKAPVVNQPWYGNMHTHSESPYVVTYSDQDYQRIEAIQQKEHQALNDYWSKQPELHEPAFVAQLQAALDREKNDPKQRVMHIWELAKYRLNKKFPSTLPFEERKALLINSSEWKSWGRTSNNDTQSIELTEDNIQNEIDSIGTRMGIQIMGQYQKLEWVQMAMSSEICKVYIPQ